MRYIKRVIILLQVVFLCFLFPVSATDLSAKSAYVMEYTSEKELYSYEATKRLYPASMTKMMSLYLVFDALEKGMIHLEDIVKVSEHAASMGGSQIWLKENEEMTVNDLLKAVCIASANDAIVALAEAVSGSEEAFVNEMNAYVREWNLVDTHFKNVSGLHDDAHYSCAKDMAIIAKHLIDKGGDLLFSYTTMYDGYVREGSDNAVWLVNTNKLLKTYPGTDGLKTGYTSKAGYCITLTNKQNGVRLIGVTMNSKSSQIRNKEIRNLLQECFAKIQHKEVFKMGEIIHSIQVDDGKPQTLYLKVNEDVTLHYISDENVQLEYSFNYKLPIREDSIIGEVMIKSSDGIETTAALYAANAVEQLEYIDYVKKIMRSFLTNL